MRTQFSSAPRVKHNPLNDDALRDLYEKHKTLDVIPFRDHCVSMINLGTGKKEKKVAFINMLTNISNKDQMLMKVQNFVFAGMGLKV